MKRQVELFQPNQMYGVGQVGETLDVHPITIWRWVKNGRLPKPYAVGANTRRFLGSELNQRLFGGGQ